MADSLVHVKGLAELQKQLDTLAPRIEANVMRGALRAGMSVVKPIAQANVHSVSGELAKGLKISTRSKGGVVRAVLRTTGIHGYIAMWVEFGALPHFISVQESEKPINIRRSIRAGKIVRASMTTVNRNVLRIGSTFVGPTVHHPGARPKAFMRPALDGQAQAAVIAVGEYVKKRLATREGLVTAGIQIEGDE